MPKIQYNVEVLSSGGWITRSTHDSYSAAVERSAVLLSRVVIASTGYPDQDAWKYAVAHQGFKGDYAAWQSMDDDDRDAYEVGAGA